MNKYSIGENAGLIWQILAGKGELETSNLLDLTKLNEKDFNMALGWLARENKIAFYDSGTERIAFLVE